MFKRTVVEPRAISVGGMPQVSFARLKPWTNISNVEKGLSRHFDSWGVEVIVETGCRFEKRGLDEGCKRIRALIRLCGVTLLAIIPIPPAKVEWFIVSALTSAGSSSVDLC